jgi:hypothetical protein
MPRPLGRQLINSFMTQTAYQHTSPQKELSRRPRWSLKTSFLAALGILSLTIPLILLTVDNSIWTRLELIATIVSFFIFAFLFLVLYQGVRFDKNERYELQWVKRPEGFLDSISEMQFGTFSHSADDLAGFLIGIILDVIITIMLGIVIALLFWLGINLIVGAITAVTIPLYFLFRRSIRYIVVRGRMCRGQIGKSLWYALRYTVINTIWFYMILFIGQYLVIVKR